MRHSVATERMEENLGRMCMLSEATQMVLVKKYEPCETLWRYNVRFAGILGFQSLGCSPKKQKAEMVFPCCEWFQHLGPELVKEDQIEFPYDCKKMHGNLTLGKREGFGFMKDTWEGGGGEQRTV